jgi:DNA-binding NarL/FixJ family response regulator
MPDAPPPRYTAVQIVQLAESVAMIQSHVNRADVRTQRAEAIGSLAEQGWDDGKIACALGISRRAVGAIKANLRRAAE